MIQRNLPRRLEQPGSSLMWKVPEMETFISLLQATRIWTWMKPFGHLLPKPSVLYANVPEALMSRLKVSWSKKKEASIKAEARRLNAKCSWLSKLMRCQHSFRTARKFWCKRKQILKELIFFYKTWNVDKWTVTGGRNLKDSAAYTRCFSRFVLATFLEAAALKEFTGNVIHYRALWGKIGFHKSPLVLRVRNLEEVCGPNFRTLFLCPHLSTRTGRRDHLRHQATPGPLARSAGRFVVSHEPAQTLEL